MSTKLEQMAVEIEALQKKFRDEAQTSFKANLKEHVTSIFDIHPDIEFIRWTQYTPYFNDGDTCEFGVNNVGAFVGEDHKLYEDQCQWEGVTEYTWTSTYGDKKTFKGLFDKNEGQFEPLNNFSKLLSRLQDACLVCFGDHVQVTVNRNGDVEVEEYEHD